MRQWQLVTFRDEETGHLVTEVWTMFGAYDKIARIDHKETQALPECPEYVLKTAIEQHNGNVETIFYIEEPRNGR